MIRPDFFARRGIVIFARLLNGVLCLTTAAFGFLSFSPFAYAEFIKPNVSPALTSFIIMSPWLFWMALLATMLTLAPELGSGRAQRSAIAYLVTGAAIGLFLVVRTPLLTIADSWRGFAVGVVASVLPLWLAAIDHIVWPAPVMSPASRPRALNACVGSALAVWACYALGAPVRFSQVVGLSLSGKQMAVALAAALAFDLFVFVVLYLTICALAAAAAFLPRRSAAEFWAFHVLLAGATAAVLYFLVCASIAFQDFSAVVASVALGAAIAGLWADIARLRVQRAASRSIDTLDAFGAPLTGGHRSIAAVLLLLLPVVAYALTAAVVHFDWNALLQKLGAAFIWLAAFTTVYTVAREPRTAFADRSAAALATVLAFGAYHAVVWLNPQLEIDRYSVVDPSLRLIRDARAGRSAETAEYYAYLRANTLLPPSRSGPVDIDFVAPVDRTSGARPSIFLFIVDSLRADYLSAYNPHVTFTPQIGSFAADSFVFERAFTRYSGTSFAVPSIWAGGMLLHTLGQPEFHRRNTLLKLLEANGYLRMATIDHIVDELEPRGPDFHQIEKTKSTMQFDVCSTVDELASTLAALQGSRPVFFYTLSQNVHISIAWSRPPPPNRTYPGFFPQVAAGVERLDSCFGGFIDFLKRTGRYDDSIIILLSDHGDSLGEEGRWGHAYVIVPEIIRIPLIIHIPAALRGQMSADLGAVTFSTDITPSLYALLGYRPANRGPLFGRPLFVAPDEDVSWVRREQFLLASSYGPVYGMLRRNSRELAVVDALDGRERMFDLSKTVAGEPLAMTPATTAENRARIRHQIETLAALYERGSR